ncbi:MAG: GNAT family N-acetyltransferase [Pseudomonadota bacterium]
MIALEIPTFETERLRFRLPSQDDFEAEAAFFQTDRSKGVGGPLKRDLVWRSLASVIGHWVMRGYGYWAIDEKATGLYCGQVGLWFPEGWPEPEVAWTLMEAAEGRGLGFEAASAARNFAYRELGWTTAISSIMPDNTRSKALASRLGATFEATFPHPSYGDMEIWRHPGPEGAR